MIKLGLWGLGGVTIGASVLLAVPYFTVVTYTTNATSTVDQVDTVTTEGADVTEDEIVVPEDQVLVKHVPLPEAVKAIYMSSCVAGTPSFRDKLIAIVDSTEVNSIVIDVKDFSGSISFDPAGSNWQYAWEAAECGAWDMREFLEFLHEKDIFIIGRVTVFQDPLYTSLHPDLAVKKADRETVWKDYKGLSFIDVAATDYWDHLVELVKESYNIGFDELNFDYIRYPSDGPMSDIAFVHSEAGEYGGDYQANLEAFFAYLNEKVDDESLYQGYVHINTGREVATPWTSADLFGMTTTNFDDLSIGQVQDRAAPYFDFIAPMVYPSHYPGSFLGLGNPNEYPYKVVNFAMQAGVDRMVSSTTPMEGFLHTPIMDINASGTVSFSGEYEKPVYTADKFRTWIQDFDYGGDYDAADVRAQIQASYDAGVNSWMIWAPSNIYTREALEYEVSQ